MQTDPIADMLTRIRNANKAMHESAVMPTSRLKEEIGLNYLMCAPLSRESFRLLADEVLPRL